MISILTIFRIYPRLTSFPYTALLCGYAAVSFPSQIWVQCIHYGDDCCGIVLESIYRILDQGGVQSTPEAAAVFISPLPSGGATTPPPQPSSTRIFHRRYSVFSRSNSGRHDVLGVRRTRYVHHKYSVVCVFMMTYGFPPSIMPCIS